VPLSPGTRLGPYEIAAPLGAGGMGEVYRARDTNLDRQVAVKILPDFFAHDPERLARFEREAKTLAALNHSHIAQIYGFEKADGIRAIVMELVEGPTLADRIAHGPVPIDETVPIARQIAEALEAAHEQGIIHRDLKPANSKVRPDGTVKVLDFGLARLGGPDEARPISSPPHATISPTITSPALVTGAGVLLGTAAYMSPEQAKGRQADKRSDIWAFGCVLYEMLTGRLPFTPHGASERTRPTEPDEPGRRRRRNARRRAARRAGLDGHSARHARVSRRARQAMPAQGPSSARRRHRRGAVRPARSVQRARGNRAGTRAHESVEGSRRDRITGLPSTSPAHTHFMRTILRRRGDSMVIVGEKGDDPLLGATTIEGFGLVLDPFRRELRPMKLPLK
jgi:serine/threonine protein kinase